MLQIGKWIDVVYRALAYGKANGLTDAQLGKALSRLLSVLLSYRAGGTAAGADRLLAGINKNLNDHPMIVLWVLRLASELSDQPWQRFFDNFVLSAVMDRRAILEKLTQELGFSPPVTLVVNPTMQCNLRCEGCYAFEYEKHGHMTPELFRRTMRESREMGIRFITLTGGEPFAHPQLLDLVGEFDDLVFMSYTNGTLINDRVADRLQQLGNLLPAFSVEGFEEHTDARRGRGVHRKVLDAMERLRSRGVMFGISATPTRRNAEMLSSDEFIDYYIDRGASFVWMFSYVPVGREPDLSLMPTPMQRDRIRQATYRWRLEKPLFIGDFWNDGATCGGCLSASRYAFVAPDGKVQPCTFVHFYTHNLNEHSLKEVFASPFFQAIRGAQPYDPNLLRPCKIIDHPEVLRQLVAQCGAKPSYPGAEYTVEDRDFCAKLDAYASEYGALATKAWSNGSYGKGKRALVPFSGFVDLDERFPDRMESARRVQEASTQQATQPLGGGQSNGGKPSK